MTLADFYSLYERADRGNDRRWIEFLRGFGAMYWLMPPVFDPPRDPPDARHEDWVRIGDDMRAAMRRVNDELET